MSAFKRRILGQTRKLPHPPTIGRWLRTLWERRLLVGLGGVVFLVLYSLFVWFTLPDITDPRNLLASQSTVITDRNGIELYRLFSEEDRTFIAGERIPLHMKQAAVSIEDERFYERGCLDMRAIARAIVKLGRAGGGSTITRQLARNALDLQKDNRYVRKVKELVLGCQLEGRYEKEELLELYLNWIPFGQNAYGVEQAARQYFNTTADKLTLAQAAVLASLPQRPSYFSPYGRHVHTTALDDEIIIGLLGGYVGTGETLQYVGGRTDQVLKNMLELEFITEEERQSALDELSTISFEQARENIRAPHFVLWIREQVTEMFPNTAEGLLEQGGLRIETSLDWDIQQRAESAIERYREDLTNRYGGENMSLVAMDPTTSEILAYVGNMDYNDEEHGGKIDMARAPRQPGSSFKPFVYAAAFQQGYSPATPIYDVETKIGDDEPQNFDGKFMGLMTMREALGASRNVPAAKAYFLAGQENQILTLVSSLGAPTPLKRKEELQLERGEFDYGWPLALGAAETPLVEMVSAYGALARGGTSLPVVSIRKITDKKGNILFEADIDEKGKEVLDERIAYQITSILSDESVRPEEYWKTQLTVPGYKTAAKTGTSNKCLEWKDVHNSNGDVISRVCKLRKPDNAWLIGYTPNLVAGAWVGNANSAAMYDKAGGLNTASPIWKDFMIAAHRTFVSPKTEFDKPEGVLTPQVSTLSGQFPTSCTPVGERRADVFLQENAPKLQDPACQQLMIDKVTKLLASDECPPAARESGSFLVAHSLLPDRWPTWEEGVQKWVGVQMEKWYASPDHSGSLLPLPVAPTEYCTLALTPGRMEKPTISIATPAPNGNATYPTFQPRIKYESKAVVHAVTYAIDGHEVATVTTPPFTQVLRVPRTVSESGQHTLTVTLVDEYFNEATARVSFTFEEDTRPPQLTVILPRADIQLPQGGELTMRAEAGDMEGGLKYVQFYLGDKLLTTKPTEPFEFTYKLTEAPGVYTIKVKAIDMAGNSAEGVRTLTIE
ncbi:MAG: penicillin-binding protein [Candidatus Peregrinibacteria bacterium]|nr:penicillin-binding protein [Candidatus Peregrinibacteria bacterium]MCB9808033.1 penicillin-binding protein [Candidatus Peribacteria bacterium]